MVLGCGEKRADRPCVHVAGYTDAEASHISDAVVRGGEDAGLIVNAPIKVERSVVVGVHRVGIAVPAFPLRNRDGIPEFGLYEQTDLVELRTFH